jgi:hypothetical protein
MVKKEHLALLKKGAIAIEEWQLKNKGQMLDLSYANLDETNLSGFNLENAYLFATSIAYANLSKTRLFKANLTCADLSGTNLSDANLTRAGLGLSELRYTTLSRASMQRVDLTGATLKNLLIQGGPVSLKGAVMSDTIVSDCTITDFTDLNTIKHKGPSHIDFDTLYSSYMNGKEIFELTLKPFFINTGMPESLLDRLPEIVTAIKYCSCFVSYGEPDRLFAEKLVTDLKAKGVQSFIFSLDAIPGEKLWKHLNEKRRKLDKMIILCSAASLSRQGVKKELEEQIDEDPDKIIPISLDNIWTQEGFSVTRDGRDLKHYLTECIYANFSDEGKYEQSFKQLIESLKK